MKCIDVKNVFTIFFIKTALLTFYIFQLFDFLVATFFIQLNLQNPEIEEEEEEEENKEDEEEVGRGEIGCGEVLDVGYNMTAIGNSLTKSHNCQALSCTLL